MALALKQVDPLVSRVSTKLRTCLLGALGTIQVLRCEDGARKLLGRQALLLMGR